MLIIGAEASQWGKCEAMAECGVPHLHLSEETLLCHG
jgi:hypothetical protein